MPAGEGSQRPKQFVKHPGLVLRPDKKIWRLRCGVRGGQGEPLDEEGPDSGKEPQSTDRAAPLCLLSAGLRVCSQHSARLEKEEPVQKPCRSVKGGRSTGQARGWGPGVEGTAWAEFEGPTAHPPPYVIYTLSATLKDGTRWQGLPGKWLALSAGGMVG